MMKIICRLFALVLIYSCSKNETSVGIVQFELKTELWPEEGGAIAPVAGNYTSNIIKSIYARPNPGWVFDRWEGAISGRENPTQISFYRDHAIRAVFKKDTFKIRTLAGGNGKGRCCNRLRFPPFAGNFVGGRKSWWSRLPGVESAAGPAWPAQNWIQGIPVQ